MSYHIDQQVKNTARARSLYVAALVLVCAFGTVTHAEAQKITYPTTPTLITPPLGNAAFLVGHAVGTQGYVCLPKGTGFSWTAKPARPEATLFTTIYGQDFQIITHFLSPDTNPNEFASNPVPFGSATWQSSFDSSKVWAQVPLSNSTTPPSPASIPAGSDPSCPNAGSIPCLWLQSIGTQQGPTGGKILAKTTFVQRLKTKGGSAPDDTDGCGSADKVGNQRLVPYTADYYFFHKDE
jgi:Protein of unknown function (DUF3455)